MRDAAANRQSVDFDSVEPGGTRHVEISAGGRFASRPNCHPLDSFTGREISGRVVDRTMCRGAVLSELGLAALS